MSWTRAPEPLCAAEPTEPSIELKISARPRSIGDFDVGRVLPAPARRMVGPFTFFDHMGPAELAPDTGMDVRLTRTSASPPSPTSSRGRSSIATASAPSR